MKEELDKLFERLETEGASAMPELYALTSPHLFGIITQILPDTAAAESALKKVYARVWTQRGILGKRHKGDPVSYMRRLAHRSAMDSKFKMNIAAKLSPGLSNASERFAAKAKDSGISEQDIRILKLAYLQGASITDISDHEKLDVRQIKVRLEKTINFLRGVGS